MTQRYILALGAACVMLASCGDKPSTTTVAQSPLNDTIQVKDEHTASNADSVVPKHLDLDIHVDFAKKQISGVASWQIENKAKTTEFRLDTYDLIIDSVLVDNKRIEYRLGAFEDIHGSTLEIPVQPESRTVAIYYKTGENARALQWLTPQQTASKKQPFLYTQSEAINARSWIPCADGPGIRYTYNAKVTVPKGLMALMSAENPQEVSSTGVYEFKMDIPIPAYLMALAVGDIRFKAVDERTGVYAEPSMIDKAAHELEDIGKMVIQAEKLYGPYRWGRYDVLILPPGFPIGGMENPKLTFATPTIIAGDKSLVNLIAHELAHNWSGNLVTNATWEDIWMNEGFTVYFERRITEAMTDKSYVDMLWELGYQDLEKEVDEYGKDSRKTWLKQDLKTLDPDDGLSDVPYEKGSLFLWLIEKNVGREKFDIFLKGYFEKYAFQSMTTEKFLVYLNQQLIGSDSTLAKKLNINAWVYGPGIPDNAPRADNERFRKVDTARNRFLNGAKATTLDTKAWTTHEWLHFLRKMPDSLSQEYMKDLDNAFGFTNTGNSEIADQWYVLAIGSKYKTAYPAIEHFLSRVGRRKFLEPLYVAFKKHGQLEMAKNIFEKYHDNYHPLAQGSMKRIIYGEK